MVWHSERVRSLRHKYFWRMGSFLEMILRRDSYLHASGWIASFRRGFPCRADGSPLPWMNYAAIALLEDRLRPEHKLFEFGSGYSTRFFAQRVASVTAVEHDAAWLELQRAQQPANVTLLHRPADENGEYCRAVGQPGERFDVIVVDGVDRVNCVREALPHLTPGGVLLLDDSQRPEYAAAFELARAAGFRPLPLEGLKPNSPHLEQTTFFYRDGNCLGL